MQPINPPVREHTIKITVLDEEEEYVHHAEVSGNLDIAGLVNAATVKLLRDLREVGYEGDMPIQADDFDVPDTLPEGW